MKKGTVLLYGKQSFSISQQKGAEIVAATNQTEKMAHSREMDLAVFTDWFPDGGSLGRHLIFDFVQLYFPPCVFIPLRIFIVLAAEIHELCWRCCTGILCRHCTIMQRFVICWWYCCCCICKKCCVALESPCSYCRKEIGFRLFPFAFAWHIV